MTRGQFANYIRFVLSQPEARRDSDSGHTYRFERIPSHSLYWDCGIRWRWVTYEYALGYRNGEPQLVVHRDGAELQRIRGLTAIDEFEATWAGAPLRKRMGLELLLEEDPPAT